MIKSIKQQLHFLNHLTGHLVMVCLLGGLILYCTCSTSIIAGNDGSGTGVGNGVIIGKVVNADSLPVQNAIVRLRSESYLADTSGKLPAFRNDTTVSVTTNSSGVFVIDSIKKGSSYRIEVIDHQFTENDSGMLYKITVDNGDSLDTIRLSTRVVKPVKELKGSIILFGLPQNAYIQVYGLERIARTDSLGKFEISQLPIGESEKGECEYKLRVIVPQKDGSFKIYENCELEIKTDSTNNIIYTEFELEESDKD
jgi:hypothetical protein